MNNKNNKFIEEELTLAEFSKRFVGIEDFNTPDVYDIEHLDVEILTKNSNGNNIYKPLKSFVVKSNVNHYYTDGLINVTANHKFVEIKDNKQHEILAKEHCDFKRINSKMQVVDVEVHGEHTYLANGRLNHNTTSGGKSLGFHSSVRLRVKSMGKIKGKINGIDQIVGMKTQVQVIKNRLGPPHKTINYDIYFDSGIDNIGGWLGILKAYKIIKSAGAWLKYTSDDGKEFQFQSKDFEEQLMSDPKIKQELYDKICEKYIMEYKPREHGETVVIPHSDEDTLSKMADALDGGVKEESINTKTKKSLISPNNNFENESN